MKKNKRQLILKTAMLLCGSLLPAAAWAQEQQPVEHTSYFSNPLFNTLLTIIIILLIMVVSLAGALKNIISSDLYREKLKKDSEQKNNAAIKTTALVMLFSMMAFTAYSQNKAATMAPVQDDRIGGLDQFTFYSLLSTIGVELLVLGIVFNTFKSVLGVSKAQTRLAQAAKPKTKTMLDKINGTVEIEKEDSILLDHNYDGIKELDNNLPPWWKYGFYLTILVAVIYLINYHITKTAPLQKEEYSNSLKKAETDIAEYMKNSAGNVDESTVKQLSDAADIASGQEVFVSTCAACHGRLGEGGVGPNLTDAYWLHGGSVKDIFKTIKYGWPDKGMKAWKEDLSPVQIAQLASFIRTLQGSNPPKAKDRQGELYMETAPATDSSAVKQDSTLAATELPK